MNTISTIGKTMAMDGQNVNALSVQKQSSHKSNLEVKSPLPSSAADVLKNMERNKAVSEASEKELQKLTEMVSGSKVLFKVNNETNRVVVTVVNPITNEVIREIPSEDAQKIAEMLKNSSGPLFDEIV